ncbi:MAG: hypothetical protein LUD50_05865 [Clostridia bacterium]|nr:hypothetical protein [Clostridia bacterium]
MKMNFRTKRKIKRIMRLSYADEYVRGYDWNGYEVYEPVYTTPMFIRGPWVVFVRGNDVRVSTDLEGLNYLDYRISMQKKEKEALSQS